MALPVSSPRKLPITPLVVAAIVAAALIAVFVYLNRPVQTRPEQGPTPEAKAYVRSLSLSDVKMTAAENFMRQQVVEVRGEITNNGPKPLFGIEVYCLFYGVDGRELQRQRLPILNPNGPPLEPHQTRSFRLPFDSVPDGWNQTVPKLVIAQIKFSK